MAWRIEALGGKFGGAYASQGEPAPPSSEERDKLQAKQEQMVTGLLACADRRRWRAANPFA